MDAPPKTDGKFEKLGQEIGAMVDQKDRAYGNSFDESWRILAVLYPNGIKVEQYADMLAICRIVDKLKRIATDQDAFGESPYRDVAGYGLLGANRVERRRQERKPISIHPIDDTEVPGAPYLRDGAETVPVNTVPTCKYCGEENPGTKRCRVAGDGLHAIGNPPRVGTGG